MLLFGSEEHVDRWCSSRELARGDVFSLAQGWGLARAWYAEDCSQQGWKRKTPEESEAVFAALGLTSPFWRLLP